MAASFSGNAKAEIARAVPQKGCCALAQCFGILLFCNSFTAENIRIITESREFAAILPKLFKKAFNVVFDRIPNADIPGKLIFQITDLAAIRKIMDSYGFEPKGTLSLHINFPIVEEECCKAAFLRGAFLSGGSVTDPSKGYHFEIATIHTSVSKEACILIQEASGFLPKGVKRGGSTVLYLKQCDQISDLLTYLGAPVAAMGIMEAKLEKEMNNKVNRRCNCDDGNISKVVEAAQEQLAAIRLLRSKGMFEHIPVKLQQAAIAREKNPAASLSELAGMVEPVISKAAMNNRFKKLVQLSQEDAK